MGGPIMWMYGSVNFLDFWVIPLAGACAITIIIGGLVGSQVVANHRTAADVRFERTSTGKAVLYLSLISLLAHIVYLAGFRRSGLPGLGSQAVPQTISAAKARDEPKVRSPSAE
jgi:hypothetical protein